MAEDSNIAWTRSTFNSWIGCTKVGPGCDNCYAEALDSRYRWAGATHWGPGKPRHHTSSSYWKQPLKWNAQAPDQAFAGVKGFWPVFCSSLSDVFDNEVHQRWREELWALIRETPNLTWLLVTKRIGNAAAMLPADWGYGYRNVWLLSTIVNEEEWDRDGDRLMRTPAVIHGVSYEPGLGPIDWLSHRASSQRFSLPDWLIIGGESTQNAPARPFEYNWALRSIEQCEESGITPFMKQTGSHCLTAGGHRLLIPHARKDGADPIDWPLEIRVRKFPRNPQHDKVGNLLL